MIQIEKNCIKNSFIKMVLSTIIFGNLQLFGMSNDFVGVTKSLKSSLLIMNNEHDQCPEDKVMQEMYVLSETIYKKIVECVALYCCGWMIVDAKIVYDKMLLDICRDVLTLIKLLAIYIPLVCKNKKIPLSLKIKKLGIASSVMIISVAWIHKYYNNKVMLSK